MVEVVHDPLEELIASFRHPPVLLLVVLCELAGIAVPISTNDARVLESPVLGLGGADRTAVDRFAVRCLMLKPCKDRRMARPSHSSTALRCVHSSSPSTRTRASSLPKFQNRFLG